MIKIDCPKLVKRSLIPAIAFLVLLPSVVFASTNATINFQGKIVRNDTGYEGLNVTAGNPACVVAGNGNDTCDFQVRYYSASSGGTLLLTEAYQNVEIGQYNGAFTLSLGSDSTPTAGSYASFEAMIKGTTDLYVQLGFAPGGAGSYTETFSRMPIQASAYAIKAKYASGANTAFQFDSAANSSGYTSPVAGMVYYDTTDAALKVYNGSTWGGLGSGTGSLFTDGGIFTYLTALTDHFVLGSSSYTAIGSDSYSTYLTGLNSRSPLSFDMTAERLTISGSQQQTGLTVYSDYAGASAWPVVSFKAEDSAFDNVVLQVTQDGTGNILSLQKGSTEAFVFENPLTMYIHPREDAPSVYTNRLYNVNGTLYWNGSALGSGSSLWTDAGTFTYLTSTTDDVVIGGDTLGTAAFFFDVSTGNLGIGTSTPGAKLDIAGSDSSISNTTGDITITSDGAVVIKANDTAGDNLMEWQDSTGAILGLINQNGYATFGDDTNNTGAMLTLGASTATTAQINLAAGLDVAAPTAGDMWWNGSSLYFFDGSTSVDLLTAGGGGSNVLSNYGTVPNGAYLGIAHDSNSYDVVASGWICVGGIYNASCSGGQWKNVQETDFTITHSLSNQWNDADTDGIIRSIVKLTDVELAPGVDVGTGADGAITVTSNTVINTTNLISGRTCADGGDAVNYSVTAFNAAGTEATLSTSPSTGCLNVDDEVLIINLQGTPTAYGNVGNYETLRVASVSGTTVTFKTAKSKYYGTNSNDDANLGVATGTQRVMLQRVPNYTDVTVNNGYTFSPVAWNHVKGGIMFFRASGSVSVAGSINANAKGYLGGTPVAGVDNYVGGGGGEAFCSPGGAAGGTGTGGAGAGGGGGGSTYGNVGYCGGGGGGSTGSASLGGAGGGGSGHSAGGGGGYGTFGYGGPGYTSAGANGGTNSSGNGGTYGSNSPGGGGGGTYGDTNLTKLMLGSAGGAGGTYYYATTSSGAGGVGGGIVSVSANSITVSGTLASNGGAGGNISACNSTSLWGGGGGGGAGGSVKISGNTIQMGTGLVTATNGAGGGGCWSGGSPGLVGGAGGVGRVAVYYSTAITGSTSPTYTGTSVGYNNYGIYNSPIISTPNAQSYDNLRWDATLNTYGKISVQTRSGNTPDPTAPTDTFVWSKYNNTMESASNTISTDGRVPVGGEIGDQASIYDPTIIKDGDVYKMWYTGSNGGYMFDNIYYATSTDGLTWTKYNNVTPSPSDTIGTEGRLPHGNNNDGDKFRAYSPTVIKDGETYKMWYTGYGGDWDIRIFYATSSDGLTWTKYDNTTPTVSDTTGTNGRLPLGTSGKGDEQNAMSATVIKDEDVYKMWYTGYDGSNYRIYYATSSDGLTWTKYDNAIPSASDTTSTNGRIPLGTAGKGDEYNVSYPTVIKDGTTYKMSYTGEGENGYAIYYATSPDGLTWTKYDNTAPTASDTTSTNGRVPMGTQDNGKGDDYEISMPVVIKEGLVYKMWYTGNHSATYYATSSDGLTWTKYDNTPPTASNTTGTNGRVPTGTNDIVIGDIADASDATVLKDGSIYKMWYTGGDGENYRIYYATSPDGQTWTKYDNTVPADSNTTSTNGRIPLGTSGRGDEDGVFSPVVIKDGSTYKMWYTGRGGGIYRIYYATSPDGLTWTKYSNTIPAASDTLGTNGRIPEGVEEGDDLGVSSPSVIKEGGVYKMWYTGFHSIYYGGITTVASIYYAISSDGITWTKYDNTFPSASDSTSTNGTIPIGSYDRGDKYEASNPSVIKDGAVYKMWYTGKDDSYQCRIYYATSSDGLDWTKYDNTIPTPSDTTSTNGRISFGLSGRADSSYLSSPTVLKEEDGSFKAWYSGVGEYPRNEIILSAIGVETIGAWEAWKPYTSGLNYLTLQSSDTHTNWTGTNATVAEGDITRSVEYFEDEDEPLGTNMTKMTSSTNGGYMESTISETNLVDYDYITLWIRASQAGNTLRIGMGEAAGTEQYEDITIDTANTWQKVYWDISDIAATSRDAITKIRLTNFSTSSNVIYLDNVRAESLLDINTGSTIASTPNEYFQYRVIFTTTNLSYQPQLESISFAYNSGYRTVLYDSNNVRLYNYSGDNQYMRLEVVASTGGGGSGGGFVNGLTVSHVADGADAIAFQFNTATSFTNPSSKLLSVMNNSVEKMYLDADGNLYVAGTITSGKGLGAALVNNSGGIVTEKSLVTVDSSTNGAFTTTTVAGLQGALGVVQGVELNGDVDGDGVCDDGDTCLVAFEGVVDVNLDNATSSSNGDYVYSSTAAGFGHADSGTTQDNGMIGVVTSTANSSSGYVQMVFNAQNKVTADMYINVSYDENLYKDMYNQLANDYASMSEAERRGVLESNQSQSIMFDSFVDSLKIDSTNSTIGVDADAQKAGLWGGVTIDNSMLDIAGNRYLGSATATLLTSKYYDRTQSGLQDQDSTPETLVDVGVDPNWYKGVSLQTTSNLTTSYNGSLIGVSGVYGTGSEHGYIDLTITGTTTTGITANIVSSDGNCSATGASLAFGSSYAFVSGSCSGSSITIKPVRSDYKNGDKFRILSWVVEPTTANDRGSKREFPERSVILVSKDASNGYVTIVDADTQRVWMVFIKSGTWPSNINAFYGTSDIVSVTALNGEIYTGENANSDGMKTLSFVNDEIFLTGGSLLRFSNPITGRNSGNGSYTIVNSSISMVNYNVNDVSAAVIPNQPTQEITVSGWGYIQGAATWIASETVPLPYRFDNIPNIVIADGGYTSSATAPRNLSDCSSATWGTQLPVNRTATNIAPSSFTANVLTTGANMSTYYYCYTWTATGQVSPKQFVAVATGATGVDGGVTVINKTNQTSINLANGANNANVIRQNHIELTSDGSLYTDGNDETSNSNYISAYHNIPTLPTDTSLYNLRSARYQVGAGVLNTAASGIIGSVTGTDQIKSLFVTNGTSTVDGKSNTIYVGTTSGLSVIQEKQEHANSDITSGSDSPESLSSVKYYTKDYISEQMVGDVRGMWPLTSAYGSGLSDASIKANTLTNNGSVTFGSGVRGQAAVFSGSNYLSCTDVNCGGTSKTDIGTGAWSVGAWIKTSNSGSSMNIITKGGSAGQYTYILQRDTNNKIWWALFNTGDSPYISVNSNSTFNDGNWHYIVGTWNPTGTTLNLYVDGNLEGTSTSTSGTQVTDSNQNFTVGAIGTTASFVGSIDEPFVTATALTASQIKSQYEDGLRALKGSHSSADTYNQLNGTSNDVRDILVTPDSKYMYVGTEGGGISKIDLTSSTRLNAYTTATDPSTSTNNIETLSGRYYPVFAGDIGSTGRLMGIDSNGNNSTGTYYSKVTTFAESTNRAFLWMTANIDATDTSSSITVSASNDNGANYVTGTLIQTNTSGSLPEYEYSFVFPTSDKNYKVKFEIARGSSNKAAIYVTKWGLSQMKLDDASVNGLFTNSNDTVANGSYLEVVHGQNTYDLVTNGWVFDTTLNQWVEVTNTDNGITQNLSNQWADANVNGIIRSIVKLTDVELATGVAVGTGGDGDITISANKVINTDIIATGRTCADAPNYNVTAIDATGTQFTISTSLAAGCLAAGDELLLINLRGTPTAYGNVGNYETLKVLTASGTTITTTTPKTKFYGDTLTGDTNLGTGSANQKVMLQRVPQYHDVTVASTFSLTPSAWDGSKGGVLFFRANGTVTINGSINSNAKGYLPGATTTGTNNYMGSGGGESFCAPGGAAGGSGAGGAGAGGGGSGYVNYTAGTAYCGGGGGGTTNVAGSATLGGAGGGAAGHSAGGGGGYGSFGYGGSSGGNNGGTSTSGAGAVSGGAAGGGGGGTYGDANLNKLMFGSGGGSGGAHTSGATGGLGGQGGGITMISANTISVNGTLASNGGNGYNYVACNSTYTYWGGGGGGAGGSVKIYGNTVQMGASLVSASAGTGSAGCGGGSPSYYGGNGGVGRIATYTATSLTGTSAPTYTGTTLGYNNYGIYNSAVISTTNAQLYGDLRWDAALNTYGKISVQTRSGATADPTDGTWEAWMPNTSGTNYTTLQSADTHTDWTGTNVTVAEGDITRPSIYGFEDETEPLGTNLTKGTSSTNGGYLESTIAATNLTNYDYVTLWVRASQVGNTLRIGMGESAATEQYEEITIDAANTWQKVYWDLSDIPVASRDAITKLRLTNLSAVSNTIYLDNVKVEKLLSTGSSSVVASTPNAYMQYRVIFTTTNLSYQPQLENITFTYSSGFKIQIVDANTVRLYNNSGKTQKLKLDVILGSAAIDLKTSEFAINLAPSTADIDGGDYTNSIWVNKMGTGGNLLKLQTNSVDMMVVSSEGDMTLAGDVAVSGGSISLGTDGAGVRFNTTEGTIEFSNDGIAWMILGESTRKVTLSAEYAGAVLSGDGSDNVGTMTSDNTGSASNSMNYYEWNSTALSLNDYDVRVRFTLPSDFDGWGSTGGVTLNYATESTSNTNNKVDMYIYKENSATIDGTSASNASTVAGVWTTTTIAGTDLNECATAGDTCVFIMRMSSLNSNYTRIGDIAITYNRSL